MELDMIKNVNTVPLVSTQPKTVEKEKSTDSVPEKSQLPQVDKSATVELGLVKQSAQEKTREREEQASAKMLQAAIDAANTRLKYANRMLQASIHEKTNRIQVKIIDSETNEVVREIPPEKTLDLFAKVLEMAGILVDERK